jgi:hypothetical protein
MATSKFTISLHQFTDEGTINVRAPMPFVCPCSYLVLIPAYLYRPLYCLLHWMRIKRCMLGSHLSWVTLLHLPSVIALLQQSLSPVSSRRASVASAGPPLLLPLTRAISRSAVASVGSLKPLSAARARCQGVAPRRERVRVNDVCVPRTLLELGQKASCVSQL